MYNDEVNRIPCDEDELWDALREQFDFVRHVLWELPVETKEDALERRLREGDGKAGMDVIRYRDVNEEIGQRDHFLELGRSLLTYIGQAIEERQLTPEFVQQWGKVMFCHGYIAAHYFDDRDDLAPERNRRRGTEASKQTDAHTFLARLILHFMDIGLQRKVAEARAARAISDFISRGEFPDELDERWFRKLLSRDSTDQIVTTLTKPSEDELRNMAGRNMPGLPPVEILGLQN